MACCPLKSTETPTETLRRVTQVHLARPSLPASRPCIPISLVHPGPGPQHPGRPGAHTQRQAAFWGKVRTRSSSGRCRSVKCQGLARSSLRRAKFLGGGSSPPSQPRTNLGQRSDPPGREACPVRPNPHSPGQPSLQLRTKVTRQMWHSGGCGQPLQQDTGPGWTGQEFRETGPAAGDKVCPAGSVHIPDPLALRPHTSDVPERGLRGLPCPGHPRRELPRGN